MDACVKSAMGATEAADVQGRDIGAMPEEEGAQWWQRMNDNDNLTAWPGNKTVEGHFVSRRRQKADKRTVHQQIYWEYLYMLYFITYLSVAILMIAWVNIYGLS